MAQNENSEVLVSCQGVSKKFCRHLKKSLWYGVKDGVSEILTGESSDELRKGEFWALKDVSFELRRGECIGLLGRNGAGKTTLLKVLSGLIKPDEGTVSLKGQVGGLIALGAGFNGILSGRENIRINGAIIGYSRNEVEEKMQEIIDFAEIQDFIDAPVNTYSSGMSVRLGFAIAAILTKPDVLLLDEVLAVGDIGFTVKCLNTVRVLMKDSAVIFVSHNMQFVSQFCSQVILFEGGEIRAKRESVPKGISEYLSLFSANYNQISCEDYKLENFVLNYNNQKTKNRLENNPIKVAWGKELGIAFDLISTRKNSGIELFLYIMDLQSTPVISYEVIKVEKLVNPLNSFNLNLGTIDLNSGRYFFTIALVDPVEKKSKVRIEGILPFIVESSSFDWGLITRKASVSIS